MRRNRREEIVVVDAEVEVRERSRIRQSLGSWVSDLVGNESLMNRLKTEGG